MEYSYNDGNLYYFMDPETYELIPIDESALGSNFRFVKENMECVISSYKGKVFLVEPPTFVELELPPSRPALRSRCRCSSTPATASASTPAWASISSARRAEKQQDRKKALPRQRLFCLRVRAERGAWAAAPEETAALPRHPSRRTAAPPSPQGEGIALRRCVISSEAGLAPSDSPAAQTHIKSCTISPQGARRRLEKNQRAGQSRRAGHFFFRIRVIRRFPSPGSRSALRRRWPR